MTIEEFWKNSRQEISTILNSKFNLDEIELLCFNLGVDADNIAGDTKSTKIISLLAHVSNREMIPQLLQTMAQERPAHAGIKKLIVTLNTVTAEPDDQPAPVVPSNTSAGNGTAGRGLADNAVVSPIAVELGPIKQRWALIVGINTFDDYAYNTLKFCENDANDMEKRLSELGYVCTKLTRSQTRPHLLPSQRNIMDQVKIISDKAEREDLILVYFATHGVRKKDDQTAWLIASDTRSSTETDEDTQRTLFESTALSVDRIISRLKGGKSKRHILLLDACHMGVVRADTDLTEQKRWRDAVHDRAQGMALLAASAADQTAREVNDNGLFTEYLLEGLNGIPDSAHAGYITVEDIALFVLGKTREYYQKQGRADQDPTKRTEGIGDMILAVLPTQPAQSTTSSSVVSSTQLGTPTAAGQMRGGGNELDPVEWDSERLRKLLTTLEDSRIRDITFDHFREVYDLKFSANTPKGEKIQALVEHCIGTDARVVLLLKTIKLKEAAKFEAFLKLPSSP
jgi:Caspase domain/Effector-associated domain 7